MSSHQNIVISLIFSGKKEDWETFRIHVLFIAYSLIIANSLVGILGWILPDAEYQLLPDFGGEAVDVFVPPPVPTAPTPLATDVTATDKGTNSGLRREHADNMREHQAIYRAVNQYKIAVYNAIPETAQAIVQGTTAGGIMNVPLDVMLSSYGTVRVAINSRNSALDIIR